MTQRKPKQPKAAPEAEVAKAPETPKEKQPVKTIHERGIVSIDY